MKIFYEIKDVIHVDGGNWGGTMITVKEPSGRIDHKMLKEILIDIINAINEMDNVSSK
jgi:hypothetical protein